MIWRAGGDRKSRCNPHDCWISTNRAIAIPTNLPSFATDVLFAPQTGAYGRTAASYAVEMCNRYETPEEREIERTWHVGRDQPNRWWDEFVFPRGRGVFIRRAVHGGDYSRELVAGHWGLIPWFAKTAKLSYSTNNARSEELAAKATYKQPWARGQRCIIPARSFDEPCWETGRNIWWRFRRADGELWGLAGLWNTWVEKTTGEGHESYTMLTVNADHHPLMRRMHKPDPKLPLDGQDKRSVIPLPRNTWNAWLAGTVREAQALLRLPVADEFLVEHP